MATKAIKGHSLEKVSNLWRCTCGNTYGDLSRDLARQDHRTHLADITPHQGELPTLKVSVEIDPELKDTKAAKILERALTPKKKAVKVPKSPVEPSEAPVAEGNREAWLERAVEALKPVFQRAGAEVPPVRIACGWPSTRATSKTKQRVGECWYGHASADGIAQIFVSPVVSDGFQALGIVAHELVHGIKGKEAGHGAEFKSLATAIGLTGKMTSTSVGEVLAGELRAILHDLGPYPHAKLNPAEQNKKQSTRLLKAECPVCGYVVRLTNKWASVALPTCTIDQVVFKLDGELPEAPEDEEEAALHWLGN